MGGTSVLCEALRVLRLTIGALIIRKYGFGAHDTVIIIRSPQNN